MSPEPNTVTRREVLLRAIKGAVAASLSWPLHSQASEPLPASEPEFVPENDYPFFGFEPESHLPNSAHGAGFRGVGRGQWDRGEDCAVVSNERSRSGDDKSVVHPKGRKDHFSGF